jgi:hypothetical protein
VLALALLTGCASSRPRSTDRATDLKAALLVSADLPGYTVSDAQSQDAQVSQSAVASEGFCDRLFDRFGSGQSAPGATASFEASATGPFLVQTLTPARVGEIQAARDAIHDCARFRSDDLSVAVQQAAFPPLGDETVALKLDATGGTGDDAETLDGYLVAVRVKDTVCTVVNYGMPGVDVGDTETVVRKAVAKL